MASERNQLRKSEKSAFDKLSEPENPIFESERLSLGWVWCYTDLSEKLSSLEKCWWWCEILQGGGGVGMRAKMLRNTKKLLV